MRCVLNFDLNLKQNHGVVLMKSGSPDYRAHALILLLALPLAVASLANAQQPANPVPDPNPPAAMPAAQTPEQAAVSASAPNGARKADNASSNASDQTVKLGPGDLIEINVYNVPELSSKVRVSNAGDVYLPLVDYVHVDGLTQEEAQTVIEKRLADGGFVRSPHVTIFVDDAGSQGVTMIGEVGKPGIYPDTANRKLYEVISQAGGFSASAAQKISVIRRNQAEPIHIELPRNLADDTSAKIEILPGDTITVPRAPIIYVVGDVGRPSGLLVDNGQLTVLQALALAGGTNKTAKLGDARIICKRPCWQTSRPSSRSRRCWKPRFQTSRCTRTTSCSCRSAEQKCWPADHLTLR